MRILYDISLTQLDSKYHGGLLYAERTLELLINSGRSFKLFISYNHQKEMSTYFQRVYFKNIINVEFIPVSSIKQIKQIIEENNIDIFYVPLPYKLWRIQDLKNINKKLRIIFVLHGLRRLEYKLSVNDVIMFSFYSIKKFVKGCFCIVFPSICRYISKYLYSRLLNNVDIITVSHHSKFSILSFFGDRIKEENIRVFYPPLREIKLFSDKEAEAVLRKYNISSLRYFLSVSMGIWYKNPYRLLRAIKKIKNIIPKDIAFVFTGVNSRQSKLYKKIVGKDFNKVILLDYVSADDLAILFKHAFSLIFPSMTEGFGYPPIEAFMYNTPVLASAVTSVPEACGCSAVYFNPYDEMEIANRILQIIHDNELYSRKQEQTSLRLEQLKMIYKQQENDFFNFVFNRNGD